MVKIQFQVTICTDLPESVSCQKTSGSEPLGAVSVQQLQAFTLLTMVNRELQKKLLALRFI